MADRPAVFRDDLLTQSGEIVAILGAAFQIGRSALAAYQTAVAVTGQNIANVGNPDYTRQSGRLEAMTSGATDMGLSPGTGVNVAGLERHVDEALNARLRLALGDKGGAETTYQALSQIESMYNELTDYDLSTQLNALFESFSSLQIDPTETTTRDLVLASANGLVSALHRLRSGLLTHAKDLNDSAAQMTDKANQMASEIAKLNQQIVTSEARSPGGAGALRDRRDSLLRDLGELMEIQTREQDNGVVNVYVGSEPLVDFARSRGLTTRTQLKDGLERVTVRFADNGGTVLLRGGRLGATLAARDTQLVGQLNKLDQLAGALIYEVNKAHTQGQGLVGYTNVTGTYAVQDAAAALNSTAASLTFPVQNGTFLAHIRDQVTGQVTTRMIEVDLDGLNNDDTTLNSLAAALGNLPHVTASVTGDNRLNLALDSGYEITFSQDSSHALASLGVGTFFDGTDAATIAVNSTVQSDTRLLAASASGAAGDGSNAGTLAAVGGQTSTLLTGTSLLDFHESMIGRLATDIQTADNEYQAASTVYDSLYAQREATSGVSLDEEALKLTQYEQAFQGASRFVSVLQTLSDSVLAMLR